MVLRIAGNDKDTLRMNSYVSLILEAEGAKERLQRLFQSTPEVKKNELVVGAFSLSSPGFSC
jgi:hypothetical protein